MLWLDGNLLAESVAPFDLSDRGLLLGDGVFDTSLVLGGKMVWREAHVGRLEDACVRLGFKVDRARIDDAIDAVLAKTVHASLRITVTRGAGPRGLAPPAEPKPSVLASVAPLRVAALFAPISLFVTPIRRNDTSPFSRVKSLNYLDAIAASRAAIAAGCDDALFFNTHRRPCCTSVGNVFLLIGEQLVTPPLDEGIVAGITRDVVLRSAAELGLEPIERSLTPSEVERADRAIVTNSLRLVAPVTAIARTHLGSSESRRVQALIAMIAKLVAEDVGIDPRTLAER